MNRLLLLALVIVTSRSAAAAAPASFLPVLVYHQIRVAPDGPRDGMTSVSIERFADQMRWLREAGYTTLSMDDTVKFLQGRKYPPRSVSLHFDDGWKSALAAVPVLEQYGFQATFWAVVSSLGSGSLYMDWSDLRSLEKNPRFRAYSHTMTHPYKAGNTLVDWAEGKTPGKSADDVRRELSESKSRLEGELGHPVPYLDWPSGLFSDALIGLATEAGYTALVTTTDGFNKPGGDALRIRRILVNGACGEKDFRAMLSDGKYRECAPPAK